jgi:PAS domain S-box-containing protein
MDLQGWSQTLGYIAGSLVALGSIYAYALRPPIKFLKEFINLLGKLDESLPILIEISHQFKPNGGNSLRDVIDRIERDIDASKARTKILLGMSKYGVYEADANGNCTWVNRRWCEIAGLMPEEAMGNGWVTAIHPDDRAKVFAEWENSVKLERDFDLVYRFKNLHTGEVTLVHGHSTVIRDNKFKNHMIYIGSVSVLEERS